MIFITSIGAFQFLILAMALFGLILPLVALIDILRSNFEGNNKIIWLLVVLLANFLGAILYFIMGQKQKLENSN